MKKVMLLLLIAAGSLAMAQDPNDPTVDPKNMDPTDVMDPDYMRLAPSFVVERRVPVPYGKKMEDFVGYFEHEYKNEFSGEDQAVVGHYLQNYRKNNEALMIERMREERDLLNPYYHMSYEELVTGGVIGFAKAVTKLENSPYEKKGELYRELEAKLSSEGKLVLERILASMASEKVTKELDMMAFAEAYPSVVARQVQKEAVYFADRPIPTKFEAKVIKQERAQALVAIVGVEDDDEP